MNSLRQWLRRLQATFFNSRLDERTDEELRFHIEMETEARMRAGLSPEQARRETRLHEGAVLAAREAVRDQRGLPWLDDAIADLRVSARSLIRQRGFTAVALTALTLAVAINTVIFALFSGVLLQPLPYNSPDRLVRVFESGETAPKFPVSAGVFLEFQRHSQTIDSIAVYSGADLQLSHDGQSENLTAVAISDDFFPTLGVQPILGRNFEESEMHVDPSVVILSHALWVRLFDQDPNIVGQTIRLDRKPWTVVGVLPPGFEHVGGSYRSPLQGQTVAVWWPMPLQPEQFNSHYMNAIARLKPGVTVEQAQQDLSRLVADTEKQHADGHQGWQAQVFPLSDEVVGGSRQTVLLLIAAGGLVLLIACANIAGLCVARGLARSREAAIRKALGARAWRLVRASMTENLLLGLTGGAAGLALAAAALPLFRTILPADFPRLNAIHLTPGVAAFALFSAVAVAVVAGLLPAWGQSRREAREALQEAPRAASPGQGARKLRSLLVTSEIALAALLCVATLLLARSARMLGERDHGFEASNVLTFQLSLPHPAYDDAELRRPFYEQATRLWNELPNVEIAALTTNIPWTGYDDNNNFRIIGNADTLQEAGGRYQAVTPGYFEAMHIPLLQGRLFNERDQLDSPPVILINQSLAERYFPGEQAVGRIVDMWDKHREIVGVVGDIRDRPSDPQAKPGYWFPLTQETFTRLTAVLRTPANPLDVTEAAAKALHTIDPELPLAEIRTMDSIADAALAERRFALWLFEAFAVLALALAAVGVYGLLAYLMEQRRKELGIRMALGARRSQIVGMVLRDGARLCAAGVFIGLLLVPLAGQGLNGFLYGVASNDTISLVAAAVLILLVGLTASLVPAWIAGRSEPMSALREE